MKARMEKKMFIPVRALWLNEADVVLVTLTLATGFQVQAVTWIERKVRAVGWVNPAAEMAREGFKEVRPNRAAEIDAATASLQHLGQVSGYFSWPTMLCPMPQGF